MRNHAGSARVSEGTRFGDIGNDTFTIFALILMAAVLLMNTNFYNRDRVSMKLEGRGRNNDRLDDDYFD